MIKQILFIVVVIITNIIHTITGFAGTMLAMPASIMLIGMEDAKAILNVVALFASLLVAYQERQYINKKECVKITSFMLLGMAVGIYLLGVVPTELLLSAYGVLIVGVALKKMLIKTEVNFPSIALIGVLFLAGIIHGMFVSGGSLLVIYAVSVLKDKKEFRATLALLWVLLNSILCVTHVQSGYFNTSVIILILISLPTALLSVKIGNLIHNKINQQLFLKITYILLLISGIMLLLP